MGRWWTGYTSISAGRLGIAHSHGAPWRFAATERLQPAYGYGLWKAKIPSEKMCSIAVCGGAGCEKQVVNKSWRPRRFHGSGFRRGIQRRLGEQERAVDMAR